MRSFLLSITLFGATVSVVPLSVAETDLGGVDRLKTTANNTARVGTSLAPDRAGGLHFRGGGRDTVGNDWEGGFLRFSEDGLTIEAGETLIARFAWRIQAISSVATRMQAGFYAVGREVREGDNLPLNAGYQAIFAADTSGSEESKARLGLMLAPWNHASDDGVDSARLPEGWRRGETRLLQFAIEKSGEEEARLTLADVTSGYDELAVKKVTGPLLENLDTLFLGIRRTFGASGDLGGFSGISVSHLRATRPILAARPLRTGSVELQWEYPERFGGTERFAILRADERGAGERKLAETDGRAFIDRDTEPGSSYSWRIVSLCRDGREGSASVPTIQRVGHVLPTVPPRSFEAILRGDEVEFLWKLEKEGRARSVRIHSLAADGMPKRLVAEAPPHVNSVRLPASTAGERFAITVVDPSGRETDPKVADLTGRVPSVPGRSRTGEHPFLFIDRGEIEALKDRARVDSLYRRAFEQGLLFEASSAYATIRPENRDLPRRRHSDHQSIALAINRVALGYAFTGNQAWGRAAAEALLEYAGFYGTIPIIRPWADGRLTGQTLNESMLLIHLAWAYDLIHDTLTADEREKIETGLFRPAVDIINRRDRRTSNWQTWHNAATGIVGFLIGEESFVRQAIWGDSGYLFQLEASVMRDGIWYEQSIAYDYFTVHALTLLAEAAYRQGMDLFQARMGDRDLKLMLDGPFYHAFSNLNQAPFGNSQTYYRLRASFIGWNYAVGARHYDDPKYRWVWEVKDMPANRLTGEARLPLLLCLPYVDGGETLPYFAVGTGRAAPGIRNVLGSTLMEDTGMAVMRGAPGKQTPETALIWKPHGTLAGHQHPNNLGIYWQSPSHRWISSSGKWARYGSDVHLGWVKQTLSDNTVVVDRISQYPAYDGAPSWVSDGEGRTSAGWLEGFTSGRLFNFAHGATDTVYEGVLLQRRVFNADTYTLDLFHAAADRPRTYDWAIHVSGELDHSSLPLAPRTEPLADGAGYQFLSDPRSASAADDWFTQWREPGIDEHLHVTVLGAPGTEYVTAQSPWDRRERTTLITSRQADRAGFVSLFQYNRRGEQPARAEWIGEQPFAGHRPDGAVRVVHENFIDHIAWNKETREGRLADASYRARDLALRMAGGNNTLTEATVIGGDLLETPGWRLRTEAPADWSMSVIDSNRFLFVYDDAFPMETRLLADDSFIVYRFTDDAATAVETVSSREVNDETAWLLQPFTNYLLVRNGKAVGQLPTLLKLFDDR